MKEYLQDRTPEDLLAELPNHWKNSVIVLHEKGMSYENIGTELAINPSFGLAVKGGTKWDNQLFSKILGELKVMICKDEPRYAKIKEQLKSESTKTNKMLIAVISAFVSDLFGIASAICIPFVILALTAILKAGIEAVCASIN